MKNIFLLIIALFILSNSYAQKIDLLELVKGKITKISKVLDLKKSLNENLEDKSFTFPNQGCTGDANNYVYYNEYNKGYQKGVELAKSCDRSKLYTNTKPGTSCKVAFYNEGLTVGFETEYRNRNCSSNSGSGCVTIGVITVCPD